jgi:hypothetical protein
MAPLLIGLGILTWVLLAVLVALLVARMIRLRDRDRQHPDPVCAEREPSAGGNPVDGAESLHPHPGGRRVRKRLADLRRGRR